MASAKKTGSSARKPSSVTPKKAGAPAAAARTSPAPKAKAASRATAQKTKARPQKKPSSKTSVATAPSSAEREHVADAAAPQQPTPAKGPDLASGLWRIAGILVFSWLCGLAITVLALSGIVATILRMLGSDVPGLRKISDAMAAYVRQVADYLRDPGAAMPFPFRTFPGL